MLDTILNLGLNDEHRGGAGPGHRQRALRLGLLPPLRPDVRQRGQGRPRRPDRGPDRQAQARRGGEARHRAVDRADLQRLTADLKGLYDFPEDPLEQLEAAVRAVFDSWKGDRAVAYRRLNGIPDSWGTAVNVQQMVFGNKGDTSCSGVAFSRDEITGAPEPSGDFLVNAQGEDVVSGVRTPHDLSEMAHVDARGPRRADGDPRASSSATTATCRTRSSRSRRGASTCSRPATPSARRRPRCGSRSMPSTRGCSPASRRCSRSSPTALEALLHPTFGPDADFEVLVRGVTASPGAAKGAIVFTAATRWTRPRTAASVVLVRPFTEADDVAGFDAARGHPHQRGRQGQPRRAGGAGDGPPVRVRGLRRWRSTWPRRRCG